MAGGVQVTHPAWRWAGAGSAGGAALAPVQAVGRWDTSRGSSVPRCGFTPRAAARCHLRGPVVASMEERWQQRGSSVKHVHNVLHVAIALLARQEQCCWDVRTRAQCCRVTFTAKRGGKCPVTRMGLGHSGPGAPGGSECPGREALGSRSHAGWKFRSGGDPGLGLAPLLASSARDGRARCRAWPASPQGAAGPRKGLQRHTAACLLHVRHWGSGDSVMIPPTAAGPGGRQRCQSPASSCHKDA